MHVQGYVHIIFKMIELTMFISKMKNLSFLRFMQLGLQSLNALVKSLSMLSSSPWHYSFRMLATIHASLWVNLQYFFFRFLSSMVFYHFPSMEKYLLQNETNVW